MTEFIINVIGFMMIWTATEVGRTPESKIKLLSGKWWLMLFLITIGAILCSVEINPT